MTFVSSLPWEKKVVDKIFCYSYECWQTVDDTQPYSTTSNTKPENNLHNITSTTTEPLDY